MTAFRVWLRPLGAFCRIRVESVENAGWLLDRLRESFSFQAREPSGNADGVRGFSFEVSYTRSLSRPKFQKFLAALPEVELMTGPE